MHFIPATYRWNNVTVNCSIFSGAPFLTETTRANKKAARITFVAALFAAERSIRPAVLRELVRVAYKLVTFISLLSSRCVALQCQLARQIACDTDRRQFQSVCSLVRALARAHKQDSAPSPNRLSGQATKPYAQRTATEAARRIIRSENHAHRRLFCGARNLFPGWAFLWRMKRTHLNSLFLSALFLAPTLLTTACGTDAAGTKVAKPQARRKATATVPAAMAGTVKKAKAITKSGKAVVVPIVAGTFTFDLPAERFVIVFVDARDVVVSSLQFPVSARGTVTAAIPYVAFADTYYATHPVFDFGTIDINATTHVAIASVNIFTVLDTDGDGIVDFDDSDDDDDGINDDQDTDDDGDDISDDTQDLDDDGDGICDMADDDDDGDGIDDDDDQDDDGDGIDDDVDFDNDDDGINDDQDDDDDNDGIADSQDPDDNGDGEDDASQDQDGDGTPDYRDDDIDGDGMDNDQDSDDDGDGTSDDADQDRDEDPQDPGDDA